MPTDTVCPSIEEKGLTSQGAERGQVHDLHVIRMVAAFCAGHSEWGSILGAVVPATGGRAQQKQC